jgi:hypothetical protein
MSSARKRSRKSGSVMRIITLEDLHQHVLDLWGKEDGIEWVDKIWMPAAHLESGTIRIHRIHSESAYAVALHEIGHIRQGRFEDLLIEERRAWEWAKANALVWTPTMQRKAEQSMGSYEVDNTFLAQSKIREAAMLHGRRRDQAPTPALDDAPSFPRDASA